jgi:hypothetical protein
MDDVEGYLNKQEKAEQVYQDEKLFRKYADQRHRGHCDAQGPLYCIEEDHFLIKILNEWDESYLET